MSKCTIKSTLLATAAAAVFAGTQAHALTMNFDTDGSGNPIVAGQIIDSEYAGLGVTVTANNPSKSFDWAIAFDAANPTGGDDDLFQPEQGNVLIISERGGRSGGLVTTPDDEANGGSISFAFDRAYKVFTFKLLDNEPAGSTLDLFLGGSLVYSTLLPTMADGDMASVAAAGVAYDSATITLAGSGAIDDVFAAVPEPITAGLGLMGLMAASSAALRRRKA